MEEEGHKQEQRKEYGSAEKVEEGTYRMGRFEAVMGAGVMLSAEDKETDSPVTFSLSPAETLQLADLIAEHRDEIAQYLFGEELARSWNPVNIRTEEGPEEIPTNQNVRGIAPDESQSQT